MDNYSVKIEVEYLGDLHCEVTHTKTGQKFLTDAPPDNNGKGEFISPTDLTAASLGSCILTIMGIVARNNNIDIKGATISVVKEMVNQPFRRIGKLSFDIKYPHQLNEHDYTILSNVVKTCPVTRSLSSDIILEYKFGYIENQ